MITINNVYKTVLSIINKEQRGFLPPNQFNKIAKQAQLDLLDKSFYEYNRFLNNKKTKRVNSGYADIPQKIKEKIDVFYKIATKTIGSSQITLDTDIYKNVSLKFQLSMDILNEMDKWYKLWQVRQIDIVLCCLPMIQALKDDDELDKTQGFDDFDSLINTPFRAIRMKDRIKKLISIDTFTI